MKKVTIILEPEFGSDFQKKVHMSSLTNFIEVWKAFVLSAHKKNKIKGEIKYE